MHNSFEKCNFAVDFYIEKCKSGRDYQTHSALNNLLTNPDYAIRKGIVLSNEGQIREEDGILYLPVYYAMYLGNNPSTESVYI